MGATLSSPVELIHVQREGSPYFRCAVAQMQGWRRSHEDAHGVFCAGKSAGFWVLDGHGGDGAALYGAPELARELGEALKSSAPALPADQDIQARFVNVDGGLRAHIAQNPEQDSGSTVVGALASCQSDGTYTLKLCNCGDSRAIIVRGPGEDKASAKHIPVRIPQHLEALADDPKAKASGNYPDCRWPLVAESVDHKPSHPTERSRIEVAGGHVTMGHTPPRLDGNLAVSRGIGDFEYKSNTDLPVAKQKVSCIPDIYEVSGVKPGSLCILACDGIWDVLTGAEVAEFVRGALEKNPHADLGDLAAELIKTCLQKNSMDNMTVMIVHLADGSDPEWAEQPDEIKNYGQLLDQTDESAKSDALTFMRKMQLPPEPQPCAECTRWRVTMQMCPCESVFYCTRRCQKKGWKVHKPCCSVICSPSQ
eukprot:gb/GFBE01062152.1/.p1 GENE.gb/GFBE01062152.1/~~gb/GFBE01062152.1/.p1  ORF type:complete len:423 (+),score=62.83 gb/GFBE01062152.1/:1-1269(+)